MSPSATDAPTYVVVGCLTMDSVVGAGGELIPRACGGNALYSVAGAHVWDERVGLVARVGEGYPPACLDAVGAAVDIGGLRRLDGEHPLRVAFAYRPDGSRTRTIPDVVLDAIPDELRLDFIDNTRDDDRYLAGTPTVDDIPVTWLEGSAGFHMPALLARSLRDLARAIREAQPDCLITTDAPWYERRDGTMDQALSVLQDIDVVLPSEEDLQSFRPGVRIVDAVRGLMASGARAVVAKVGANGSIVADTTGSIAHVPAYPADVIDPTGAGDSFCGGFLVGLRETGDLVRAALYGTVAASFVVEERAAIPIFAVTRAQAERRLVAIESRVRHGIRRDQDWRNA